MGTLPSPAGQSPRYQIVQGSVIHKSGQTIAQTIRLDTWTGETWTLTNFGGQTWTNVPESDSSVLRQFRAQQSDNGK